MYCVRDSLVLVLLACLVAPSLQATPTYRAGVVEYFPSQKDKFEEKVSENLKFYEDKIEEAGSKNVDILVFPEATLNGGIKNRTEAREHGVEIKFPNQNSSCPAQSKQMPTTLERLACKAKEKKIYVVVNLSEKQHCSKESQQQANDDRECHKDGWNFFNTNIVFDRTGAVVARYRKFNLFSEKQFDTTKFPEHSTFVTDFNVTFGLFTCFDIMFNEPTLAMVREGVRDFAFPTMWFSELPFLTARQVQEYWAYSNDANLLAAGASNTKRGSGGSGIYAGKMGPLDAYMSTPKDEGKESENNKLLTAEVPILKYYVPVQNNTKPEGGKKSGQIRRNALLNAELKEGGRISKIATEMDKFKMIRDNINEYASEVISSQLATEICNNDLCCKFNVTSEIASKTESGIHYYQYRAIVGDVVRSFSGMANGGIKACGIVACSGDDIKTCGVRFNDSTVVGLRQTFKSIYIEGKFPNIIDVFTMPDTLSHDMLPLGNHQFQYHENKKEDEDEKIVTMQLRGLPVEDLQTFAIFGRDFRYDGSGSSILPNAFALSALVLCYLWKYFSGN